MAKKEESKKEASKEKTSEHKSQETSRDEQVGYHKGSLMTLSKERQELMRILQIVEQLMQMHASALSDMGVKMDEAAPAAQAAPKAKKPPIEDIL